MIRSVAVFCGANPGHSPVYIAGARSLGVELATRGLRLVYGGASLGLMGAVADAALEAGGEVIGVLPKNLDAREVGHRGLTRLHIVDTMHERKAMMADLADAFIALPGGYGTIDETFEVLTWSLLGLHQKPCGFLDVAGYYGGLLSFLDRAVVDGFLRLEHRALAQRAATPAALLEAFAHWKPAPVPSSGVSDRDR